MAARAPYRRALAVALALPPEEAVGLLGSAGCLPPRLRQLACGDPAVLAVSRLLANRRLSPEALADFRACVEAMAQHWRGGPR